MDIVLLGIIVAVCLVAFLIAWGVRSTTHPGGNDQMWDPSEDRQGTGTPDGSSH